MICLHKQQESLITKVIGCFVVVDGGAADTGVVATVVVTMMKIMTGLFI